MIDRLWHGYVIDFLDFHWRWLTPPFQSGHFSAFNPADGTITVSVALIIMNDLPVPTRYQAERSSGEILSCKPKTGRGFFSMPENARVPGDFLDTARHNQREQERDLSGQWRE